MDLLTVTNDVFAPCAFNLMESYIKNGANEQIHVCYFDLSDGYISFFKERYGDQINLFEVERVCSHSHAPRFYFPKGFALKYAANNLGTFLMCDASHSFVKHSYELETLIEERGRFFIEYPTDLFKNKHWATNESLKIMGLNSYNAKESQSYWSGLHGYVNDAENKKMLLEQYEWMLNPKVAGPSNLIRFPEGNNSDCIGHRNDQTVLSLMIHKYGFRQPFDINIYNSYGDLQTMQAMLPEIFRSIDLQKVKVYSRHSKHNNFAFLNQEMIERLSSIREIYKVDRNTGNYY